LWRLNFPKTSIVTVTAGLRCAPDMLIVKYIPKATPIPHDKYIDNCDPYLTSPYLCRLAWAYPAKPNNIKVKVPKNSASTWKGKPLICKRFFTTEDSKRGLSSEDSNW